jgi:hypothetical protein
MICKSIVALHMSSCFDLYTYNCSDLAWICKASSARRFVEHQCMHSSKSNRPRISAIVGTRTGSTMCTTTPYTTYALVQGSMHRRLLLCYGQSVCTQPACNFTLLPCLHLYTAACYHTCLLPIVDLPSPVSLDV